MEGYFWRQAAWLGALGCQGKKLSCVITSSTFHCLCHFQICFCSQGHWGPTGRIGTWVREEREAKNRNIWSQTLAKGRCQFCSTLSGGAYPSGALYFLGSHTDHDKMKHSKNDLLRSWGFRHHAGGGINVETGSFWPAGDKIRGTFFSWKKDSSHIRVAAVEGRTSLECGRNCRVADKGELALLNCPTMERAMSQGKRLPVMGVSNQSCKWMSLPSEDSCFAERLT